MWYYSHGVAEVASEQGALTTWIKQRIKLMATTKKVAAKKAPAKKAAKK